MHLFSIVYFYVQKSSKHIILAFVVLGGLLLGHNHLLGPAVHGVAQLLKVLPADVAGPENLQFPDQLGCGLFFLVLQLALQFAPAILNTFQIRTATKPVNDLE